METPKNILPQGMQLFHVMRKSDPKPVTKFFANSGSALLWALLSNPDLQPIPIETDDAESIARTFVGKLATHLRFPVQGDYVLYMTKVTAPFEYLADAYPEEYFHVNSQVVNAGPFSQQASHKLPASFKVETLSPLLSEQYILTNADPTNPNKQVIDFDSTYEYLSGVFAEAKAGGINLIPITDYTLRCPVTKSTENSDELIGCTFGDSYNFMINWENVWRNFIITRQRTNEKSQISGFLTALANDEISNKINNPEIKMLTGVAPYGYDDCIDNIAGFYNQTGNSCFMDSTLMAMFAFKNSPFFNNMVMKDIDFSQVNELVCDTNNPDADTKLRQTVQYLLREDVKQIYNGVVHQCTLLRTVLGRQCKGDDGIDLSLGNQDPYELYQRLTRVINYYPMRVKEERLRARDEIGTDRVVSLTENLYQAGLSLSVNNLDLDRISWPYSWLESYENLGGSTDPNRPWVLNQRTILNADCIVVHLDRSTLRYTTQEEIESQQKSAFTPSVFGNSVFAPSPFADVSGMLPAYNPFGGPASSPFSTPGQATITPLGSKPAPPTTQNPEKPKSDKTKVIVTTDQATINPRYINVDQQFDVDGRIYVLKAVVYSPSPVHYACLLKCGRSWYDYNDIRPKYEYIHMYPVAEADVINRISTRGVLFFYYPLLQNQIQQPMLSITQTPQSQAQPQASVNVINDNNAEATEEQPINDQQPKERLRITSFNVSYYTMGNQLLGSEKIHVQECQTAYPFKDEDGRLMPNLDGWFDKEKLISTCALNSAGFLSSYDIMGLQEVNQKYQNDFFRMIGYFAAETYQLQVNDGIIDPNDPEGRISTKNTIPSYKFLTGFQGVTLGYNEAKVGSAVLLTGNTSMFPTNSKYGRGIIIAYFPGLNLLFINIHAPHEEKLELSLEEEIIRKFQEIESKFPSIKTIFQDKYSINMDVQRIIMTGDFNDYRGLLTNVSFKLLGLTMRIPNNLFASDGEVIATCCSDSNHIYPGDYIFDTQNYALDREVYGPDYLGDHIYYGLPLGYIRTDPLMSDHDPIILNTLI